MTTNKNGLDSVAPDDQALNPKTEQPVKRVFNSLDQILKIIASQQAANVAYDLIMTDTQQPNQLADAALLAENPRAFLAQIQKRIVGGRHG
jgi:CHASE2 domain-containing sensor protein